MDKDEWFSAKNDVQDTSSPETQNWLSFGEVYAIRLPMMTPEYATKLRDEWEVFDQDGRVKKKQWIEEDNRNYGYLEMTPGEMQVCKERRTQIDEQRQSRWEAKSLKDFTF